MEEAKAAAYYDELTRKGEGAARFKQGLGFSSQSSDANTTTNPPPKGSALPSSSSFLSSFVRAASPGRASELKKEIELENIQKKLQKKPNSEKQSNVSDSRRRDGSKYDLGHDSKRSRRRSSSRDRDRSSRRRSRSRSRSRDGHGSSRRYRTSSRDRERRRRRSPSSSAGEGSRRRGSGERKNRGRSRSLSPLDRRLEKGRSDGYNDRGKSKNDKEKNTGLDYSRLIEGFTDMTPAEKVKAKMKLQLSKTVEKDNVKGMGAGWERFEFNKDAPLDDEEEIEVAEDDAAVVKHMGQSFRFSAVEARREEEIKAAHDEAMFGVSAVVAPSPEEPKDDTGKKESNENGVHNNLISEKVLAKQQGSWRDRARKLQDGSKSCGNYVLNL